MASIFEDQAEVNNAEQVIRLLARGVDPHSRQKLDPHDICHDPEIIRSLFFAAEALRQISWRYRNPRPKTTKKVCGASAKCAFAQRERVGQPWRSTEDSQLKQEFSSGLDVRSIAERHERSRGAISARLVALGCITVRAEAR